MLAQSIPASPVVVTSNVRPDTVGASLELTATSKNPILPAKSAAKELDPAIASISTPAFGSITY